MAPKTEAKKRELTVSLPNEASNSSVRLTIAALAGAGRGLPPKPEIRGLGREPVFDYQTRVMDGR